MSIAGVSATSVLNELYASGRIGNNNAGTDQSLGKGQTISQIRDQVDKLALSGQLSTLQQVELIESGFQDLNAADPSYQPAGQGGYTRATPGTFDFAATLQSIGQFDTAHGDLTAAATFNGLADLFEQKHSPSEKEDLATPFQSR